MVVLQAARAAMAEGARDAALEPYRNLPHVQAFLAENDMVERDAPREPEIDELALLYEWCCKFWRRSREEGLAKALRHSVGKLCARRRPEPRLLTSLVVVSGCLPYLEVTEVSRLSMVTTSLNETMSSTAFLNETAKARGVSMSRLETLAHVHIEDEVNRLENIFSFNFATTFLHDRFKPILKRIAKLTAQHPSSHVVVETHVDPAADLQTSRQLARVRGNVVMKELRASGLEERRIELRTGCTLPEIDRPRSVREHRRVDVYIEMDGIQFPAKKKEPSAELLHTMQRLDGATEADLTFLLQHLVTDLANRTSTSGRVLPTS
eukprot:TRINITY_DN106396_c0_g1_i1.p1 TRINITY_DN106396_c0_g1~~TRINITY_DN106396_c0_g1_i1.p1  ORF type:complete len:322 (+),score=41.64 TRINITY_DN106396_c0_g1_i1:69-1034(+)